MHRGFQDPAALLATSAPVQSSVQPPAGGSASRPSGVDATATACDPRPSAAASAAIAIAGGAGSAQSSAVFRSCVDGGVEPLAGLLASSLGSASGTSASASASGGGGLLRSLQASISQLLPGQSAAATASQLAAQFGKLRSASSSLLQQESELLPLRPAAATASQHAALQKQGGSQGQGLPSGAAAASSSSSHAGGGPAAEQRTPSSSGPAHVASPPMTIPLAAGRGHNGAPAVELQQWGSPQLGRDDRRRTADRYAAGLPYPSCVI